MSKAVPFNEIPTRGAVPGEGIYRAEIEAMQIATSKDSGKHMIVTTFRFVEPVSYAGFNLDEYYVVGTVNDPGADQPETWLTSRGAQRWRRTVDMTKVSMAGKADDEAICAAVQGAQVLIDVYREYEPLKKADGSDNPWAYRKDGSRNSKLRIREVYAVGDKPVGVRKEAAPPPVITVTQSVPDPGFTADNGTPLVTCPQCGDQVAGLSFGAHITAHSTAVV